MYLILFDKPVKKNNDDELNELWNATDWPAKKSDTLMMNKAYSLHVTPQMSLIAEQFKYNCQR